MSNKISPLSIPEPPPDYLEWWYSALEHPMGKVFKFEGSRKKVRTKLYEARARANDPELARLSIILPGGRPNEVIIVHKRIEVEIADEET